ncbi:MAG: hypothetical protein QOD91_840, partial [Frankiales bacterium]|nr:hypothetical protein [Frankiales bacterium]
MLRRSVTGAVVGVLALTAAACSSSSSTPKAGSSTTAASTSASAPATSTGATSAPASTGAPSATAPAATGGAGHGGVTLAASAPLSTKQGSKPLTVENNPIPSLEDNFNAFDSNGFGYKLN